MEEAGQKPNERSSAGVLTSWNSLEGQPPNDTATTITFAPEADDGSPVALVWQELTVTAKRNNKRLLKAVSGRIHGGFYAIMGPSGSGKTTLLNALACRLDANTKANGEVRLNGLPYGSTDLKKMAGYVMQDDLLNGNLSVVETLTYTAQLRLPPSCTAEQISERVDLVIQQVGLEHARHTVVGTPLKKGISGGERKRLCVALELLTSPVLLFLDEPTSGLDSVTALSVCTLLKRIAASNACTVVCTIHQPQAKIFRLFDQLLLLKAGEIVYQGPTDHALDFFSMSGYPCPAYENPADHFLDVITPSMSDSYESLAEKDLKLKANYHAPEIDLQLGLSKGIPLPREQVSWNRQFMVLLQRSMMEQWRKRRIWFVQLAQMIIMAVLIGTAFLHIGTDQRSTVRRQPVLFFCVINQGVFAALIVINSFPSERALTLRERAAGTYYVSAYFLAKMTAETVTQLPLPIVFSCIVYFLVGLQGTAAKFFIFTFFMVLCSMAATSLALMVSAIGRTTDMATTILPMGLEIGRLFGGFFLSPANLPTYFSWLDALSYVKYCYVALSLNELNGLHLHCLTHPNQLKAGPDGTKICPITSGQQTIDTLGLDYMGDATIANCAGILIAYIVICRVIAFLGIRYLKH